MRSCVPGFSELAWLLDCRVPVRIWIGRFPCYFLIVGDLWHGRASCRNGFVSLCGHCSSNWYLLPRTLPLNPRQRVSSCSLGDELVGLPDPPIFGERGYPVDAVFCNWVCSFGVIYVPLPHIITGNAYVPAEVLFRFLSVLSSTKLSMGTTWATYVAILAPLVQGPLGNRRTG
jgi:hypothetical protein